MNLSPSTVLVIIVVTALANILILLFVASRSRTDRGNRLADVDGVMSSSYGDEGHSQAEPQPGDRWLASGDRWPTATDPWQSPEDDWPAAGDGWPPSTGYGAVVRRQLDPVDPPAEPFEIPAPTTLEQRSLELEDAAEESDWEYEDPIEPRSEDAGDEGDMNVVDNEMDESEAVDAAESEAEAESETEAAGEAQPPPTQDGRTSPEVSAADVISAIPTGPTLAVPRGRDALTGLLDAMAFEDAMSHEDAREQRYGHAATVIVFELDGLTKLVDRLGTEPGDRIETALGDTITRLARRADYVARLERGRYAVLLPETDEVAAINYVERVRRACDLWLESGAIAMRLAIGWASTNGDAGLTGAIRVATERMRVELRRNGRQAGDETAGIDALNGTEPAEAVAGL